MKSLWVDPSPAGGGIINGCQNIGFDVDNRPIITYHKADANGNMQIYAARFQHGTWLPQVLTSWREPIVFSGRGSMGFIGIRISGLTRAAPGVLTMAYRHRDYGSGRLMVDEQTLRPSDWNLTIAREYPKELYERQTDWKGMGIRRARDIGSPDEKGVRYILQWETLPHNHDRPRKPPLPGPSTI